MSFLAFSVSSLENIADVITQERETKIVWTYLVKPCQSVSSRIRPNVALEVNVVAFLDVLWIQRGAHLQSDDRGN